MTASRHGTIGPHAHGPVYKQYVHRPQCKAHTKDYMEVGVCSRARCASIIHVRGHASRLHVFWRQAQACSSALRLDAAWHTQKEERDPLDSEQQEVCTVFAQSGATLSYEFLPKDWRPHGVRVPDSGAPRGHPTPIGTCITRRTVKGWSAGQPTPSRSCRSPVTLTRTSALRSRPSAQRLPAAS